MRLIRYLVVFGCVCSFVVGCSPDGGGGNVPSDFLLVVDAEVEGAPVQNVNIRIDAKGNGYYERYDTGGVIRGDENDMVTYDAEQVLEAGDFRVSQAALQELWETIEENRFFELTGDYRMAMGFSYAFIVVEADGRRHQVFNIGMEVPEIRAIVEATDRVLPEGVSLEYREGVTP